MKKFFSFIVAGLILSLLVIGSAEAATKAKTADTFKGIMSVMGIADLSSGDTLEVDSNGSMQVEVYNASGYTQDIDSDGNAAVELFDGANQVDIDANGTLEVGEVKKSTAREMGDGTDLCGTEACVIHSIIVQGTTAGDSVSFYDAATAAGTAIFDITVGTALGTEQILLPGGVAFTTDVSIDATDDGVWTTILYTDS